MLLLDACDRFNSLHGNHSARYNTTRSPQLVRIQDENGMLHEARQISIAMSDPVLNEDTIDQVSPISHRRLLVDVQLLTLTST